MAIRIPTNTLASYTQIVTIEGIAYTIGFDWNTRDETWAMLIGISDGTVIVRGLTVLPAVNMTARFKDVRLPTTGDFVCFNIKDSVSPPGRESLVEEVQIWFLTNAEIAVLPDGFAKVI